MVETILLKFGQRLLKSYRHTQCKDQKRSKGIGVGLQGHSLPNFFESDQVRKLFSITVALSISKKKDQATCFTFFPPPYLFLPRSKQTFANGSSV